MYQAVMPISKLVLSFNLIKIGRYNLDSAFGTVETFDPGYDFKLPQDNRCRILQCRT